MSTSRSCSAAAQPRLDPRLPLLPDRLQLAHERPPCRGERPAPKARALPAVEQLHPAAGGELRQHPADHALVHRQQPHEIARRHVAVTVQRAEDPHLGQRHIETPPVVEGSTLHQRAGQRMHPVVDRMVGSLAFVDHAPYPSVSQEVMHRSAPVQAPRRGGTTGVVDQSTRIAWRSTDPPALTVPRRTHGAAASSSFRAIAQVPEDKLRPGSRATEDVRSRLAVAGGRRCMTGIGEPSGVLIN